MKVLQVLQVMVLLLFLGSSCQSGQSQAMKDVEIRVYKLADGDSFEGRADGVNYRVRLYGIDAPERGQDFYRKSKDRLGELCAEGPVTVKPRNRDSFGRLVADVYTASGKHINAVMVEEAFYQILQQCRTGQAGTAGPYPRDRDLVHERSHRTLAVPATTPSEISL